MPLDRDWIEQHIPHKGRMCLLDEVLSWDALRIRCRSGTHRAADNPLRAHGRLGVACGIEYAAQAMAVHGALCASGARGDGRGAGRIDDARGDDREVRSAHRNAGRSAVADAPKPGMLASARGIEIEAERLDDIAADLTVIATRQAADAKAIAYSFEVLAGDRRLLSGRATVVLIDPSRNEAAG